jgi:hypothetical protein
VSKLLWRRAQHTPSVGFLSHGKFEIDGIDDPSVRRFAERGLLYICIYALQGKKKINVRFADPMKTTPKSDRPSQETNLLVRDAHGNLKTTIYITTKHTKQKENIRNLIYLFFGLLCHRSFLFYCN